MLTLLGHFSRPAFSHLLGVNNDLVVGGLRASLPTGNVPNVQRASRVATGDNEVPAVAAEAIIAGLWLVVHRINSSWLVVELLLSRACGVGL